MNIVGTKTAGIARALQIFATRHLIAAAEIVDEDALHADGIVFHRTRTDDDADHEDGHQGIVVIAPGAKIFHNLENEEGCEGETQDENHGETSAMELAACENAPCRL